jgi:hypothetical protein
MKNYGPARCSGPIDCLTILEAVAGEVPDKPVATWFAEPLEEQQVTTVTYVIANSEITPHKLHVAELPFPRVEKDSIAARSVVVPVLATALSGEKKNERRPFRC